MHCLKSGNNLLTGKFYHPWALTFHASVKSAKVLTQQKAWHWSVFFCICLFCSKGTCLPQDTFHLLRNSTMLCTSFSVMAKVGIAGHMICFGLELNFSITQPLPKKHIKQRNNSNHTYSEMNHSVITFLVIPFTKIVKSILV